MAKPWALSEQERADTAARIAANLATLSFFKGHEVSDTAAAEAAIAIEKKAYTAASVAARTTTGDRPAAEITSGYIRCAGLGCGREAARWRMEQFPGSCVCAGDTLPPRRRACVEATAGEVGASQ
jgi:hypothetical protein